MTETDDLARAHHARLQANGLTPVSGVYEAVFTGMLMSSLMNNSTRRVTLSGLGLPQDLTVSGFSSSVNPIDLAISAHDAQGVEHGILIEIKGRRTNFNAPGSGDVKSDAYRAYNPGEPEIWDRAPSQLDRAHQIVGAWLRGSEVDCPHCGYPQTCPRHGCLRGCRVLASVPKWQGWPKTYPFLKNQVAPLTKFIEATSVLANDWHYLFLDYNDREAADAADGTCHKAWTSAPMSTLAKTLWTDYALRRKTDPVRHALAPLLQVIYTEHEPY